jgi:hypothetical protein
MWKFRDFFQHNQLRLRSNDFSPERFSANTFDRQREHFKAYMFEKPQIIVGIFMEKTSNLAEKASHSIEKTTETMASLVFSVMDKLAGKESDVKLNFDDLTVEVGIVKAKLNGSIVLNVIYSKNAEEANNSK